MFSDDSLDEYDDNIEYLNDYASPDMSPIQDRKALIDISLQDLNEINDLSASNQSFSSPLKFNHTNQALIEQITQSKRYTFENNLISNIKTQTSSNPNQTNSRGVNTRL